MLRNPKTDGNDFKKKILWFAETRLKVNFALLRVNYSLLYTNTLSESVLYILYSTLQREIVGCVKTRFKLLINIRRVKNGQALEKLGHLTKYFTKTLLKYWCRRTQIDVASNLYWHQKIGEVNVRRNTSNYIKFFVSYRLFLEATYQKSKLDCVETVSYTHLDVYKRQVV